MSANHCINWCSWKRFSRIWNSCWHLSISTPPICFCSSHPHESPLLHLYFLFPFPSVLTQIEAKGLIVKLFGEVLSSNNTTIIILSNLKMYETYEPLNWIEFCTLFGSIFCVQEATHSETVQYRIVLRRAVLPTGMTKQSDISTCDWCQVLQQKGTTAYFFRCRRWNFKAPTLEMP